MAKVWTSYKVQKCISLAGKLPSGVRVGRVWETVAVYKNITVAERVAMNLRQDLKSNEVRVSRDQHLLRAEAMS